MKITINNNTVNLLSKAKQSKAKLLLYLLTNNYFKFLFQKYLLHLVKSFLTSINFDNLSKSDFRLVINKKYFKKEY